MFRVKQFLKIASLIACVLVMGIALGVGDITSIKV